MNPFISCIITYASRRLWPITTTSLLGSSFNHTYIRGNDVRRFHPLWSDFKSRHTHAMLLRSGGETSKDPNDLSKMGVRNQKIDLVLLANRNHGLWVFNFPCRIMRSNAIFMPLCPCLDPEGLFFFKSHNTFMY